MKKKVATVILNIEPLAYNKVLKLRRSIFDQAEARENEYETNKKTNNTVVIFLYNAKNV